MLERASARETAMRVCLGAICAQFLGALGITTRSYVHRIGSVEAPSSTTGVQADVEASDVRNPDGETTSRMIAAIDAAKAAGDTLGGQFVVQVDGVPVGIGSNRQPDQRLDGILAGAFMAMQTVKSRRDRPRRASVAANPVRRPTTRSRWKAMRRAREQSCGRHRGRHEQRSADRRARFGQTDPDVDEGARRRSICTQRTDAPATVVRSDVCVVPAAAIVGEAMVRLALMAPVLEKYGGDSMEETLDNLRRSARRHAVCSRVRPSTR